MPSYTLPQTLPAPLTALITGANSGLGLETATQLAGRGARVIMAVRNQDKGQAARADILQRYPAAQVEVIALDLGSLASVQACAGELRRRATHLDLLINNAGLMFTPKATTTDGFELQMGTNHLGHFALTAQLWPLLTAAAAPRIISLSSIAHYFGRLNLADINWQQRRYSTFQAYCDSKLANMIFHRELSRRCQARGLNCKALAAHPGVVATNLMRHTWMTRTFGPLMGQSPRQGALPTLRAALDTDAGNGDIYGPAGLLQFRGQPVRVSCSRRARNELLGQQLWDISAALTGVEPAL